MLKLSLLPLLPLLLTLTLPTSAQTPPNFTPSVPGNHSLTLTFTSNTVSPPGELIPRPETASPPTIISPITSPTSRGILFMIDIDVPRNNTRVTLLHWFAPNVTFSPASTGSGYTLNTTSSSSGAPYLQPSPPVGDIPHAYILLLFAQPANFSISAIGYSSIAPPASTNDRIGFSITDFVGKAGLGPPLAANWITVQNTTGVATTTFPDGSSATASASASVTPYKGAAEGGVVGGRAWTAAVVAGFGAVLGGISVM